MTRAHGNEVYLRLKAAYRRLIEAAGGLEAASEATRVAVSILSDYQNIHKLDRHMPGDIVADLEKSVGDPVVTRELAALQGRALSPVEPLPDADSDRLAGACEAQIATTRVVETVIRNGADGVHTPAEDRELLRDQITAREILNREIEATQSRILRATDPAGIAARAMVRAVDSDAGEPANVRPIHIRGVR